MEGIASSATSVIIAHVAALQTRSGSLRWHHVAEPCTIGHRRAVWDFGSDVSRPHRSGNWQGSWSGPACDKSTETKPVQRWQRFPEQLHELRSYFNPELGGAVPGVKAVPGEGMDIPIWLLGSSGFSAQLAAQLGFPFAFGSHFAPDYLLPALKLHRSTFQPSPALDKPYVMIGVNVITADTDEKAQWLATSMKQQFLNVIRGEAAILNHRKKTSMSL